MARTTATLVTLLLLLVCCGAFAAALVQSGEAPVPSAFHCQRTFAGLDSMAQLTKLSATENCHTPYFNVTEAEVTVQCETDHDTTCRAVLNVGFRVADDAAERLATQLGTPDDYFAAKPHTNIWLQDVMTDMSTDAKDPWRFALTLKSRSAGSSVNYKGFDGNGFSVCCDMLNGVDATETPHCQHISGSLGDDDMEQDAGGKVALPFRIVRHCPLPVPLSTLTPNITGEAVVHGRVAKPLHVLAAGDWEARLTLWRRRGQWVVDEDEDDAEDDAAAAGDAEADTEMLLRVIVPFHVSDSLWKKTTDTTTAGALQPVDGDDL